MADDHSKWSADLEDFLDLPLLGEKKISTNQSNDSILLEGIDLNSNTSATRMVDDHSKWSTDLEDFLNLPLLGEKKISTNQSNEPTLLEGPYLNSTTGGTGHDSNTDAMCAAFGLYGYTLQFDVVKATSEEEAPHSKFNSTLHAAASKIPTDLSLNIPSSVTGASQTSLEAPQTTLDDSNYDCFDLFEAAQFPSPFKDRMEGFISSTTPIVDPGDEWNNSIWSISPHDEFGTKDSGQQHVVLLVGPSGSGKTRFVSSLLGEAYADSLIIGTQRVQHYSFQTSQTIVHLFDTPAAENEGTDADTYEAAVRILSELRSFRSSPQELSILYFHRITDSRMQGTALRFLKRFKELCPDMLKTRVVFATTCWDVLGDTGHETALERELELMNTDEFWGSMIRSGSRVIRLDGSPASAKRALENLESWRMQTSSSDGIQDGQPNSDSPLIDISQPTPGAKEDWEDVRSESSTDTTCLHEDQSLVQEEERLAAVRKRERRNKNHDKKVAILQTGLNKMKLKSSDFCEMQEEYYLICHECCDAIGGAPHYVCNECYIWSYSERFVLCLQCKFDDIGCDDPNHELEYRTDSHHDGDTCTLIRRPVKKGRPPLCYHCDASTGTMYFHCCDCDEDNFFLCYKCLQNGQACLKSQKHKLFTCVRFSSTSVESQMVKPQMVKSRVAESQVAESQMEPASRPFLDEALEKAFGNDADTVKGTLNDIDGALVQIEQTVKRRLKQWGM